MEQGGAQICSGMQDKDDMSARRSACAAGRHTLPNEVGTNPGHHDQDTEAYVLKNGIFVCEEIKSAHDLQASNNNLAFNPDTSATFSGFVEIVAAISRGQGTQGLVDISNVSSDDGENADEEVDDGLTGIKHEDIDIKEVDGAPTMTSTFTVWDFKSTLEGDIRKLQSESSFHTITPTDGETIRTLKSKTQISCLISVAIELVVTFSSIVDSRYNRLGVFFPKHINSYRIGRQ